MNEIVHSIFVIKYWLLSKKINSFWFQNKDQNYIYKKWILIAVQTLFIIFSAIVTYWYDYAVRYYSVEFQIFYNLPPFMIVGIMGTAFWNLRGIGC